MGDKLIDTIKEDCIYFEKIVNKDKMVYDYMYLNQCKNSKENNLYQLVLNGCELWYGTLEEINAVVKALIRLVDKKECYIIE